jgi:glutamate-ammonia-ligase adenylyltransferase
MNDRQTHTIPAGKENHKKIARRLNLNSAEEFKKKLRTFRHDVRKIYDEILSTGNNLPVSHFNKIQFANSARSGQNIAFLRSGRGIINRKEFDTRTSELFGTIEPEIINYLKDCPDPDKVLDNFAKVIRGVKFPSVWFGEFSNPKSLRNFLNICLHSQRAVDIISTGKQFEDLFLSHQVYIKKTEDFAEYSMNEIILSISVQFALRLITADRASEILSSVIKQKIESLSPGLNSGCKYFLGGLGSFGSGSMNFSSDIDLIIVADNVDSNPAIQKDFQNFILKINEAIKPFTADLKLRPEGNKSPLVWDIKNYAGYLQKRARVWEFQSLSKLIFVSGDQNLFSNFRTILLNRIAEMESGSVHSKIADMYQDIQKQNFNGGGFNIKKERGGLLTIDFILRLILFSDFRIFKKCFGKTNSGLFSLLKKIVPADDLITLKNNYLFLSKTALAVQNSTGTNSTKVPGTAEIKSALIDFLKLKDADEFDNKIIEVIKSNNLLFDKYASRL